MLGTVIGFILMGVLLDHRIRQSDRQISTLKTQNMQLETDVMDLLMMQNLQFETRYMQNGTAALGFPIISGSAVQTEADFMDFVYVNYTFKEILLTPAGIPQTVLEISRTPRPVEFQTSNWMPPVTNPNFNELQLELALFNPGINALDTLAQNFVIFPYSHVTASKIVLAPDCITPNLCFPETAFSPRYVSSGPTYNAVQLFPDNTNEPGTAVLQFIWGQYTYASIGAQYDFSGSTIEFTDSIQILIPAL